MKLKDGEARVLADLLRSVARPRTPEEAEQVGLWLKRLEGGR